MKTPSRILVLTSTALAGGAAVAVVLDEPQSMPDAPSGPGSRPPADAAARPTPPTSPESIAMLRAVHLLYPGWFARGRCG